jgi:hypothetical protein
MQSNTIGISTVLNLKLKNSMAVFQRRQPAAAGVGVVGRRTGVAAPLDVSHDDYGLARLDNYFSDDDDVVDDDAGDVGTNQAPAARRQHSTPATVLHSKGRGAYLLDPDSRSQLSPPLSKIRPSTTPAEASPRKQCVGVF